MLGYPMKVNSKFIQLFFNRNNMKIEHINRWPCEMQYEHIRNMGMFSEIPL